MKSLSVLDVHMTEGGMWMAWLLFEDTEKQADDGMKAMRQPLQGTEA